MSVLHYECDKSECFHLASELKSRNNMLCLAYAPHTHMQGNETLCLAFLIYLWMKEKGGMAVQFMQRRRAWVLECCLCCLGRYFGHSKIRESSMEFFLCWHGPEHVSPSGVPCLPWQEHFRGNVFWVPAAKMTEMLVSWGSQAKVTPLQTSDQGTPLTRRIWISKKYCEGYSDCSRGTIFPQHDLVPLTEPHILFPAPSIRWLRMNWRDILNHSTPHIQ